METRGFAPYAAPRASVVLKVQMTTMQSTLEYVIYNRNVHLQVQRTGP